MNVTQHSVGQVSNLPYKGDIMNTYKVYIGISINVVHNIYVVRAIDIVHADKLVYEYMGDDYDENVHVVKIEELEGEFIE